MFAQSWLLNVISFIVASVALFYFYFKYSYLYWKRRGVPFINPSFPWGNFADVFLFRKPLGDVYVNIYNLFEGSKVGGFYLLCKPALMVRDLDIIKNVLVKDFAYFQNRGMYHDEENDDLLNNLFFVKGKKWKFLRRKLTPTFTSGKMKMMFQKVLDCGIELNECVKSNAANGDTIEVHDILARYTTDVIASCAFGIQCNCLKNPKAEFRIKGIEFFNRSFFNQLGLFFMFFIPSLAAKTKLGNTPKAVADFFQGIVTETVEYREKNQVTRNDFMQLLIQLKNRGYVDEENSDVEIDSFNKMEMRDIVGQAFSFFLAGSETSSATMSFCLYQLAVNPDIQTRLRQEIDEMLIKHNGVVTYEGMLEMEYLDQVIAETMRMYPTVSGLNRECNTAYTLPDSDVVIEPGVMVVVPVYAIHHDPRYYPDPQRFDPDRFTKEEKAKRNPYTYMPFGEGPRICIGMRFGLMQAKIGLISLLRSYEIKVSAKTVVPIVIDPKLLLMGSKDGIHLQIIKRH